MGWDLDIREEMLEEVLQNGTVVHIFVDKDAAQGDVYLKFEDVPSARCTQLKMAKRGFGARSLEASFVSDVAYAEKFPDSVEATTALTLEGVDVDSAESTGGAEMDTAATEAGEAAAAPEAKADAEDGAAMTA